MSKMTVVHLGVIVFAICLSTQVFCMNSTVPNNVTIAGSKTNSTTMATNAYSSSVNSTSPSGQGVSLQSGLLTLLLPFVMTTSLLRRSC